MRALLMAVALASALTMSGCHKATVKVTNLNPIDYSHGDGGDSIDGDIVVWLLNEAEVEELTGNPIVETALGLPFKIVAAHDTEKFYDVCKGVYGFVAANADVAGLDPQTPLEPGVNFNFTFVGVPHHGKICIKVFNPEGGGPPEIINPSPVEPEPEPEPDPGSGSGSAD